MMKAQTAVGINEVLANRRSPRSLDATAVLSKEELLAVLEAARWAPSAFNGQPWRFFVGQRGDEVFAQILDSLAPFNQGWAYRSSVLILVAGLPAREDGTPNKGYLYDCGLAAAQMVVETHHRGLVAHQMTGFDPEKAVQNLGIDASLIPVAVIAIGKQASAEQLEGPLLERENAPRERKALEEIVVKGLPS
ncbi:MAG: oxidoreductase [Actinobacteria bacterium]|jgi:nitroreductase|nr:oxidoreductase [Actinomycetota bacterium]NCX16220.1 oxidoreductase [Actinomycetota bacterium]